MNKRISISSEIIDRQGEGWQYHLNLKKPKKLKINQIGMNNHHLIFNLMTNLVRKMFQPKK